MDQDPSVAAALLVRDALRLSAADRARQFAQDLPVLSSDQVPLDDHCPICLVPFLEILSPARDTQDDPGVTKLEGCGHIFCRRDLIEWVKTQHGNCPTCRFQFMPFDVAFGDDASSDGGEYIPPSEGEEDLDFEYDYAESDAWDYEEDLEISFYAREAMMQLGDDEDDASIVDQAQELDDYGASGEEFDYEQDPIGVVHEAPNSPEDHEPEHDPFSCFDPVDEPEHDPNFTPEDDHIPDEIESLNEHGDDGCHDSIDTDVEGELEWGGGSFIF